MRETVKKMLTNVTGFTKVNRFGRILGRLDSQILAFSCWNYEFWTAVYPVSSMHVLMDLH